MVSVASVGTNRLHFCTLDEAVVGAGRNLFYPEIFQTFYLDWFFDKVASRSLSALAVFIIAKCVKTIVDGQSEHETRR